MNTQHTPHEQLTTAIGTISELHRQRAELHAENDRLTAKVLALQFELGKAESLLRRHGIEAEDARDKRVAQRDSPGHHAVCVAAAKATGGAT